MEFKLLNDVLAEQKQHQTEIERKSQLVTNEQEKLNQLNEDLKRMVLEGIDETELDKMYALISEQEVKVQRRKSEYELVKEVEGTSKFTAKELSNAFSDYRNQYKETYIDPINAEMEELKKQYLEKFTELSNKMQEFNAVANITEKQLLRLRTLNGGSIYGASSFEHNYPTLDITVPKVRGL